MSDQNLDFATIWRNVEKGVYRQKWMYRSIFFVVHLLLFVVSMVAVWGTLAADSQLREVLLNNGWRAAIIVILPTILWALVILCHVAAIFIETSAGEKTMREQLLMREA